MKTVAHTIDFAALKERSCWLEKYLQRGCLTWFCSLEVILMMCGWCFWNLIWSWIILFAIRLPVFWFFSSSFAFVLKPHSTYAWSWDMISNIKNWSSHVLFNQNSKSQAFLVILWFCLASNSGSNGFRTDQFI